MSWWWEWFKNCTCLPAKIGMLGSDTGFLRGIKSQRNPCLSRPLPPLPPTPLDEDLDFFQGCSPSQDDSFISHALDLLSYGKSSPYLNNATYQSLDRAQVDCGRRRPFRPRRSGRRLAESH